MAINPAMIRTDPVTTLAAWTTLSMHSRYPFLTPRNIPRHLSPGPAIRSVVSVSDTSPSPGPGSSPDESLPRRHRIILRGHDGAGHGPVGVRLGFPEMEVADGAFGAGDDHEAVLELRDGRVVAGGG